MRTLRDLAEQSIDREMELIKELKGTLKNTELLQDEEDYVYDNQGGTGSSALCDGENGYSRSIGQMVLRKKKPWKVLHPFTVRGQWGPA